VQKRFRVIFSPPAQREIEGVETNTALQLVKDIKTYLEASPFPFGKNRIKKMSGYNPPLYRLRSGDFRAYYRILSDNVIILVITHKKDAEKLLKKLR
jgi:mRNA-degrading endonuclease RelE of RelBE toxin-antitoxin system